MIGGVNYEQIDARGLHVSYGEQRTDHELIEADTIVLCTGQNRSARCSRRCRRPGARCT